MMWWEALLSSSAVGGAITGFFAIWMKKMDRKITTNHSSGGSLGKATDQLTDKVDQLATDVKAGFHRVDDRLDSGVHRFERIETKLDSVDRRVIETRVSADLVHDRFDRRLINLEQRG